MKKLFILALSATLAACQLSTDSDEAAKDVAQQWAEAFFNCDFHKAESCSTTESSSWLHFAAANTMPHDIDLLNERNAQVESVQLQSAGSDTLRTAVLKVRDYVRPTALGDESQRWYCATGAGSLEWKAYREVKSKVSTKHRMDDGEMLLLRFVSGVHSLHTHIETDDEIVEVQAYAQSIAGS